MNVDSQGVAMFLHIAFVVVGMMLAGMLHLALIQCRRADQVVEMRPWVPVLRRVEPALPIMALGTFATGAWLVHLSGGEVTWVTAGSGPRWSH